MKSMFKRMTTGNPNVTVHNGAGGGITEEEREMVRKADEELAASVAQIKQEMAEKHQNPVDKTTSQ